MGRYSKGGDRDTLRLCLKTPPINLMWFLFGDAERSLSMLVVYTIVVKMLDLTAHAYLHFEFFLIVATHLVRHLQKGEGGYMGE